MNKKLGDVIKDAPIIVRGSAKSSYSDFGKSIRKAIYTYTDFVVTEVLKGELNSTQILIRQPGGSKDDMEMVVPGTAQFTIDEDVIILLGSKNLDDNSYDVPGLTTGKYIVKTNSKGEIVLFNSLNSDSMYDEQENPKSNPYGAEIKLEVFKNIIQGQTPPEAEKKQFQNDEPIHPNRAPQKNDSSNLSTQQHNLVPIDTGHPVTETSSFNKFLWMKMIISLCIFFMIFFFYKKRKNLH